MSFSGAKIQQGNETNKKSFRIFLLFKLTYKITEFQHFKTIHSIKLWKLKIFIDILIGNFVKW